MHTGMIDPAADLTNTNTSPSAAGDGGCDDGIIILSKPSRLSRRARRGAALSTSLRAMEGAMEQEQQQQPQESTESFVSNKAVKQPQQQQHQQTAAVSLVSIADTAETAASVSNSSADVSSDTPRPSDAPFAIVSTPTRISSLRNQQRRPQQQQKQKQRSRRLSNPIYTRKAISFNLDRTTTHDVEAVSGMTDEEVDAVWYSERDLDDMQEDVANALYALTQAESGNADTSSDENGGNDNDNDSELPDGRGLEGMRTAEERAQLRRARERTWDAVLDEQDRQWDAIDANDGQDEWGEAVEGCMLLDPDALGEVSRQTTAGCVASALQLAEEDAVFVEQMVREDMVQNARAARLVRAAISQSRRINGGSEDAGEPSLSRSALSLQVSQSDRNDDGVTLGPAPRPRVLRDSRSARLATRRGSTGSLSSSSSSARRATRPVDVDSGFVIRTGAVRASRKGQGSRTGSPASATPPAATSPSREGRPMLHRSGGPSRLPPEVIRRTGRTANNESVLENLRSARQMERYGESRRFLATGGSFRTRHPSSEDDDPYLISEAGSIHKLQEIAARKLRKGKHKKSGLSAKAGYGKSLLDNSSSNNGIGQNPQGMGRVGTLLKGKMKLGAGKHQSRKGGSAGAEGLLSKQSSHGHAGIKANAAAATGSMADDASSRSGGRSGAYDFIPLEA